MKYGHLQKVSSESLGRNSPKGLFCVAQSVVRKPYSLLGASAITNGGSRSAPFPRCAALNCRVSTMKVVGETLRALKTLPVGVAILDPSGRIVAVNDNWKDFGRRNGLRTPNFGIGSNYQQYCTSDERYSPRLMKDLSRLLSGRLDLLTLIYPCHSPRKKRWFALIGLPLALDQQAGVALLHINLTDMLPISALQTRPRTGHRRQSVRQGDLNTIGGAIEEAAADTLAAQLNRMLIGPAGRAPTTRQTSAHSKTKLTGTHAQLSKRQLEILRLLGEGKTNKQIAEALFRSPNTVKLHVSAILRQLNLKSRTQAALLASTLQKEGSNDPLISGVMSWKKTRAAQQQ